MTACCGLGRPPASFVFTRAGWACLDPAREFPSDPFTEFLRMNLACSGSATRRESRALLGPTWIHGCGIRLLFHKSRFLAWMMECNRSEVLRDLSPVPRGVMAACGSRKRPGWL